MHQFFPPLFHILSEIMLNIQILYISMIILSLFFIVITIFEREMID